MKGIVYLICVFCSFLTSTLCAGQAVQQTDSTEQNLASSPSDTLKVVTLSQLSSKYLTSVPYKAKKFADEALLLARKLKFYRGEMMALNNLSEYHFRQSNYARAIEYATQLLKAANQRGDSSAMSNAYRVLGNINTFGLKQYDQALIYHLKAMKIIKQQGDPLKIAAEHGSITWIYAITNENLDEAYRQASEGVTIARKFHNDQILSYNYNSKGFVFLN